jgi:hypothetical protein
VRLLGDQVAEGREADARRVVREAGACRLGGRFDDVRRRREVGIADLETNDVLELERELHDPPDARARKPADPLAERRPAHDGSSLTASSAGGKVSLL